MVRPSPPAVRPSRRAPLEAAGAEAHRRADRRDRRAVLPVPQPPAPAGRDRLRAALGERGASPTAASEAQAAPAPRTRKVVRRAEEAREAAQGRKTPAWMPVPMRPSIPAARIPYNARSKPRSLIA